MFRYTYALKPVRTLIHKYIWWLRYVCVSYCHAFLYKLLIHSHPCVRLSLSLLCLRLPILTACWQHMCSPSYVRIRFNSSAKHHSLQCTPVKSLQLAYHCAHIETQVVMAPFVRSCGAFGVFPTHRIILSFTEIGTKSQHPGKSVVCWRCVNQLLGGRHDWQIEHHKGPSSVHTSLTRCLPAVRLLVLSSCSRVAYFDSITAIQCLHMHPKKLWYISEMLCSMPSFALALSFKFIASEIYFDQ